MVVNPAEISSVLKANANLLATGNIKRPFNFDDRRIVQRAGHFSEVDVSIPTTGDANIESIAIFRIGTQSQSQPVTTADRNQRIVPRMTQIFVRPHALRHRDDAVVRDDCRSRMFDVLDATRDLFELHAVTPRWNRGRSRHYGFVGDDRRDLKVLLH